MENKKDPRDLRKEWKFQVKVKVVSLHGITGVEAMRVIFQAETDYNYSHNKLYPDSQGEMKLTFSELKYIPK